MKKLSNRQLKVLRNVISIAGVVIGIIMWCFVPAIFKNSDTFHVGNGEYGSKYGILLVLLLQLFAFIPYNKHGEEIHTDDPEERKQLELKNEKKSLEIQVIMAIAMAFVICGTIGIAVIVLAG